MDEVTHVCWCPGRRAICEGRGVKTHFLGIVQGGADGSSAADPTRVGREH